VYQNIPMAQPDLTAAEVAAVNRVLQTSYLSLGPQLEDFETCFARYLGTRYAVGVNSGTSGLHLAVIAAGIGEGDLVITTPFSFVASANCILYERAIPIFVDVDPITGNIDPAQVTQAAADLTQGGAAAKQWLPPAFKNPKSTPALRAGASEIQNLKSLLPVHAFGQSADMDPLREIANQHGLLLFEDAAEAHGACYKGQRVGNLGDAAIFSFYGNKIITTGEGGIIVTNNKAWAERAFFLENQGRYNDNPYWHPEIAYNYRMTNVQAAVGLAQLERIEEMLNIRRRNAAHYNQRLAGVPGLTLPPQTEWATNVYWMYSVIVGDAFGISRDDLRVRLREAGIDTRPFFYPVHTLPMYNTGQSLPVAEDLGRRGLNLPSGATLTPEQIDYICDTIIRLKGD